MIEWYKIPLSPLKSGLQIPVGHFFYLVSPKISHFLNFDRKRTFAVTSGFARNAISRLAVAPGRRHGHPHNTLIIKYHLFPV